MVGGLLPTNIILKAIDEFLQLVYSKKRDAGLCPEFAGRLSGCVGVSVRMSPDSLSECDANAVRMQCDCRPVTAGISTYSLEIIEYSVSRHIWTNYHLEQQVCLNRSKDKSAVTADPKESVFISYSWNDTDVADGIEEYLGNTYNIKRDIRDLGAWSSINEFMQSIRNQDYAILIISESYLKSRNCMYEILEVMKEKEFREKIFPVVLESTIYQPLSRIRYIEYWEKESEKLELGLKNISITNVYELGTELKIYKNIASSIGDFLKVICDMNNPNIESVNQRIDAAIKAKRK